MIQPLITKCQGGTAPGESWTDHLRLMNHAEKRVAVESVTKEHKDRDTNNDNGDLLAKTYSRVPMYPFLFWCALSVAHLSPTLSLSPLAHTQLNPHDPRSAFRVPRPTSDQPSNPPTLQPGEAMMKRNQGKTPGSSFDDPSPSYGGGGGLGKGYGGSDDFGLGKGYGGLDDFGDDDLGTGNGGGSGEGGKKDDWGLGDDDDGDFGFGNKMPPPGSSDPVPAAVEEDEGSDGEGGVLPMEGGGGADPAVSGKEETGSVSATEAGKQTAAVDM